MSVRRIVAGVATILMAHAAMAPAAVAQGLPSGGSVASGTVIIGSSGRVLTITQSSQSAIVNWNSFSIGQPNTVNINQPNSASAILNRVTGSTASTIAGQLNANGVVFLINPNGIAITSAGTVNVGGGFVASTLGMSDAEFLAGRSKFTGNGASASVSNAGLITVGRGGYAALIGGTVSNSGRIVVPLGRVGLGSGKSATLNVSGDDFLQVAVPTKRDGTEALIQQSGTISAPGGTVVITAATAREAARNAINMSGVIEANTVGGQNGSIVLGGGPGGEVNVSGEMSASGAGTNAGGRVSVSGGTLFVTGKINTSGASGGKVAIAAAKEATVRGTVKATGSQGKGGTITATAPRVVLEGATLDASGATGGGSIALGGGTLGGSNLARANVVSINSATTIAADATETGNGGNIVVWSDQSTDFAGLITARGGARGGAGGTAEVSSKTEMRYTGLAVLTAANGATGTLLLDTKDLFIAGAGSAAAPAGWSTIGVATLAAQLAQANVVLTTSAGLGGSGNIELASGAELAWSSTSSLTLTADNSIVLAGTVTAPNGALTLGATRSITDTAIAKMSAGAIDLTAASVSLAGAWQANGGILGIAGRDAVLGLADLQHFQRRRDRRRRQHPVGTGARADLRPGTARGSAGSGGTILLNGTSATTLLGATVDASGTSGGGVVTLGGVPWAPHATAGLTIDPTTTVAANATLQGNGGTITAWSEGTTVVWGRLDARRRRTGRRRRQH